MTPRQRVMTTFEHEQPDRVPVWIGSSPEFWNKAKSELQLDDEQLRIRLSDDFRRVFADYVGPEFALTHVDATCRTVFGIERHGIGYGHPLEHPLANATLDEIHNWAWPNPDWMDASAIPTQAARWEEKYAILGGDWSPFWHDAIDLLGMENLYVLMHEQPERVDAVFQHLVDYYFSVNQRIFDIAGKHIDIFFLGNDLGSQTGPLLGPNHFRRFLMPHFKRLIDLGHAYGLKVQLHCCGGIFELIPLLIEAGLDALHAVQPSCRGMELHRLKATFGKQLVFNGGIDSHHVLIDGDVDYVRTSTRETLATMMPGGGFVAGASHDTILEQTPVANLLAMIETVQEYGTYN